jgi:hypothetical protein
MALCRIIDLIHPFTLGFYESEHTCTFIVVSRLRRFLIVIVWEGKGTGHHPQCHTARFDELLAS